MLRGGKSLSFKARTSATDPQTWGIHGLLLRIMRKIKCLKSVHVCNAFLEGIVPLGEYSKASTESLALQPLSHGIIGVKLPDIHKPS